MIGFIKGLFIFEIIRRFLQCKNIKTYLIQCNQRKYIFFKMYFYKKIVAETFTRVFNTCKG